MQFNNTTFKAGDLIFANNNTNYYVVTDIAATEDNVVLCTHSFPDNRQHNFIVDHVFYLFFTHYPLEI